MQRKKYKRLRFLIILFVFLIVALAAYRNSYLLSLVGVLTAMLFMIVVRQKAKIKTDERDKTVGEKAAKMAYAIFVPTLGISAVLFLFPSNSGWEVFAKGEFAYLESIGVVFAYLVMFLIILYTIAYYFFNRQYGGGVDEK